MWLFKLLQHKPLDAIVNSASLLGQRVSDMIQPFDLDLLWINLVPCHNWVVQLWCWAVLGQLLNRNAISSKCPASLNCNMA